jgi:transposase
MIITPNLPSKVQFLEGFSFPIIKILTKKNSVEAFLGGRPGYDKELLFFWLLVRKITNWDYRTISSMAGVSHPTLIRANNLFISKGVYQKVFTHLVKMAYKEGLIKGEFVAMDSSFVKTFSGKQELGSEGWNGHKKGYGFKLHLLIDAKSHLPIALIIGNGLAADCTLAVPLLKKARPWLKKVGYVLADKGYDDTDIVNWVVKELSAKASIPMRAKSKLAKGKVNRYGNLANWRLKAKGRSFKKSIYNKRTSVERVFSFLKRTYHLGQEESKGILNFAKQVYLALISYMLKKLKVVGITQI